MSGMAILLLCTLQVDHSGWRTQSQRGSGEAAAAVEPNRSGDVWQEADQLLERAGEALQERVSDTRGFVREQQNRGIEDVRGMLPRTGLGHETPPTTSGWPEIEQALGEPASSGASTARAAPATLRDRMRGPEHIAVGPPSPPADWANERGDPATLPFDAASTRSLADQSGEPSAGLTAQTETPLGGQARLAEEPFDEAGREVIFEGPPNSSVAGRERYLSPPPRDDELAPVPRHDSSALERPSPSDAAVALERSGRAIPLPEPPAESPTSGSMDPAPSADAAANSSTARPWGPLLIAVLGLFGSLGFNFYLGWIAWDLYTRYQDAVDDIQALEAKLEAKQQESAMSAGPHMVARHTPLAAG